MQPKSSFWNIDWPEHANGPAAIIMQRPGRCVGALLPITHPPHTWSHASCGSPTSSSMDRLASKYAMRMLRLFDGLARQDPREWTVIGKMRAMAVRLTEHR